MSGDQAHAAFDNFVQLWTSGTTAGRRAPVLRRPDEVGLNDEDVFFPSMDGVPLEGWVSRPTRTGSSFTTTSCPATATAIRAICPSSAVWADSR